MPNAGEYRQAADRFSAEAKWIEPLAVTLTNWPLDSIVGGPVVDSAGERLGEVVGALGDAHRELSRLADECRRRAAVCDEYAREVYAYWARPLHLRLGTVPPVPPYPWVSA